MRIALASPYDFATQGGVNQHIDHLRAEFQRLGHEVEVIAPLSGMAPDVVEPGFHGFGGVFPIAANGSVARISFSLNLRSRIKQLMAREHFDVVHYHEPLMPALSLVVLNYSRSVNVGTFHAYAESNLGYLYARPVLQRFFNRLDGLVAVSEPAAEFASQYFPGDWHIIPNGVDTSAFIAPAAAIAELMDGRPNILFLGRFEEERKGFKYALRALPWVKQVYPDVRLVVVGPGDSSKFRGRVRKYGLEENVIWAGRVSDHDRVRYMASCQLLVAPSTHGESQGIVLLEAMAAGLPVVAGDIPGYASILSTGREGILVPPESEHGLSIAIVRLLADPGLRARMGSNGIRTASEYSWPEVAGRLLEFYTEIRDRKARKLSRDERRSHLRVVMARARRA
ncbi:MAG: glycosyltransferase family 4 protein [Chloroflexota bacterium]|nr:glycosyltransferase family 4 protein [Chloroflexota bacterium]